MILPGYEEETTEVAPLRLTRAMVNAFSALPVPAGQTLRLFTATLFPDEQYREWCRCLHDAVSQDNALASLFWWQQDTADAQKGSLAVFTEFCRHAIILMLLETPPRPERSKIVGLGWLTDIVPGEQAAMGVWYATAYRAAHNPTLVTHAVMGWALHSLGLKYLWGQTISPHAVHHLRECGGQVWAEIPDYIWYGGERRTLTIVRAAAETWAPQENGARHG